MLIVSAMKTTNAGRTHVAGLTTLSAAGGGTGQPFRIRAVHGNAEHDAFVATGAITAFVLQRRMGVFATVHVIQRSKEQLALAGAEQAESKPPVD